MVSVLYPGIGQANQQVLYLSVQRNTAQGNPDLSKRILCRQRVMLRLKLGGWGELSRPDCLLLILGRIECSVRTLITLQSEQLSPHCSDPYLYRSPPRHCVNETGQTSSSCQPCQPCQTLPLVHPCTDYPTKLPQPHIRSTEIRTQNTEHTR